MKSLPRIIRARLLLTTVVGAILLAGFGAVWAQSCNYGCHQIFYGEAAKGGFFYFQKGRSVVINYVDFPNNKVPGGSIANGWKSGTSTRKCQPVPPTIPGQSNWVVADEMEFVPLTTTNTCENQSSSG